MTDTFSRIEREFIVRRLTVEPPSLLVQTGAFRISISPDNYSVINDRIHFKDSERVSLSPGECIVYFDHKKRKAKFKTQLQKENSVFYCIIPDHIFKLDTIQSISVEASVAFSDSTQRFIGHANPLFPLWPFHNQIHPLPGLFIQTISRRLSIPETHTPLLSHLYRVIDFFRTSHNFQDFDSCIPIFIDNQYFALLFSGDRGMSKETLQHIEIQAGIRKIQCTGQYLSSIPVTASMEIFVFTLHDMQAEDSRFLFEKCFHEKFDST